MSGGTQPNLRKRAPESRERQPAALGASRMAGVDWARLGRAALIASAAGVFLALIGAFRTDSAPILMRLLYWVPVMALGATTHWLVERAVQGLGRPAAAWARAALAVTIVAPPWTLFIWAYTNRFFGFALRLDTLPFFAFAVLVISIAMTTLVFLAMPRLTHAPAEGGAPAPPPFLARLPAKLKGAQIYAVEAEDHYLRVHSSKGSDLILMRLSDAIGELEGIEGAQTHRSWWVAREAVERLQREGERLTLVLRNGLEAPVSRGRARALRQAGWDLSA